MIQLIIEILVAAAAFGMLGRAAAVTNWRDTSIGNMIGFGLAVLILIYVCYAYFVQQGQFFRWIMQGIVVAGVAGFIFKKIGEYVGTPGSRKIFRTMPVTAAFGILTIIVYAILAIFANVIAPYGEEQVFEGVFNTLPGGDPATGGDPRFPLGTDQLGRDLLSRLIYGARNTVGIAFVTTCLTFLLGATFGFLAAILGGWFDQIVSRIVDALMAIPQLIFALLLMTAATTIALDLAADGPIRFLGFIEIDGKTLVTIFMVLIIAVLDSTRVFRLSRAVGQNIVVMDYIEAAKLRGETLSYLVFREILPNAYAPLLAEFGLR
ncbi:MAG: ABC transporter permease, partial [Pseudomonadota bacterium]